MRIRYVADLDGKILNLFSIGKQRSGLRISYESGLYVFDGKVELQKIKSQHFSVHDSNYNDTTISNTVLLENGKEISDSAFLKDSQNDLCWTIFARRVQLMEDEFIRKISNRRNEKVVNIGKFSQKGHTLFYSVHVSKHKPILEKLSRQFLFYTESINGKFVSSAFSFAPLPSHEIADVRVLSTSDRIIKNEESPRFRFTGKSKEIKNIIFEHYRLCDLLAVKMIERIEREKTFNEEQIDNLRSLSMMRFSNPVDGYGGVNPGNEIMRDIEKIRRDALFS